MNEKGLIWMRLDKVLLMELMQLSCQKYLMKIFFMPEGSHQEGFQNLA
jgi:hypothetical protein